MHSDYLVSLSVLILICSTIYAIFEYRRINLLTEARQRSKALTLLRIEVDSEIRSLERSSDEPEIIHRRLNELRTKLFRIKTELEDNQNGIGHLAPESEI